MSDLDVLRDLAGRLRPPSYDDLVSVARTRRRRLAVATCLATGAAVVVVVVGMLTVTRDTDTAPPVAPPVSPTPTKSQGDDTWVDTAVTPAEGVGWDVPDPLAGARDAWPDIVAGHLHVTPTQRHADWYHAAFEVPVEGSDYSTSVEFGVLEASRADGLLADGCSYLHPIPGDHRKESCGTEQIEGPNGEPVHVTSFQSLCTSWDPGRPGDDARPAPGSFRTCGDYGVTVVAERSDGRVGWVDVDGRDYVEAMPFALTSLAAAAADPRLVLPDAAYEVPSDQAVASVVSNHFPTWREPTDVQRIPLPEPGRASTSGNLRRLGVSVSVWPAGGTPTCGRSWLVSCVERRVYGADDSTTVFVGAWGNEDCDFCSRNSRADSRVFVFVGPRNTVVVGAYLAAKAGDEPMSPDLDQRLIDLALDPRLQRS